MTTRPAYTWRELELQRALAWRFNPMVEQALDGAAERLRTGAGVDWDWQTDAMTAGPDHPALV